LPHRLVIVPGFLVAQIQQTFHVFPDFRIFELRSSPSWKYPSTI
jgi:hypothetical protein